MVTICRFCDCMVNPVKGLSPKCPICRHPMKLEDYLTLPYEKYENIMFEVWFVNHGYASLIFFQSRSDAKRFAEKKGYEAIVLRTIADESKGVEHWHPLNGWEEIE